MNQEFKNIAARVDAKIAEKVKAKAKSLELTVSQYLRKLVREDLNTEK